MERHRRFRSGSIQPAKGTYLFGARGTPERLAACPGGSRCASAVRVPVQLYFGTQGVAWFAALIVAAALYNARRSAFKGRPGGPAEPAGYLLVFVLASWLNHISQVPWFTFVFGAMFAMHSHLFRENHGLGGPIDAPAVGPWPACWEHGGEVVLVALLVSKLR